MTSFTNGYIGSIKIAYTNEEAFKIASKIISNTERTLDCIFDQSWLHFQLDNPELLDLIINLKLRGITSRFVTTITRDNMSYCKKIMKYSELKHSDRVSGYLGISDGNRFFNYLSPEKPQENDLEYIKNNSRCEVNLISIDNRFFVQEQHYLFENLWNHSLFAREKITEIEREVVESIIPNNDSRDQDETIRTLHKMMESAIDQIIVLFPNTASFWDVYNEGIFTAIKNAINRDVTVKILIHIGDNEETSKETIRQKLRDEKKELEINTNFFSKQLRQKQVLFVVDEAMSAKVETKFSNSGDQPSVLIESSAFSKNISQISSEVSMFDLLWIKSEVEKQDKIKQTYFQIFKGITLKEETYKREWIFNNQKENDKNNK
ncbi:MAG TPA: hypothetical protein VER14_09720 [Phototrophicaceae bacterium]|nr:hypothetical protein [Phototrophicaceae bacterium]